MTAHPNGRSPANEPANEAAQAKDRDSLKPDRSVNGQRRRGMSTTNGSMREKILRTAARLFMKYGYGGTSMADIGAAVKLTKGSLYHYFPGKSDILYEIYGGIVDEISIRVDRHDRGLPAEDRLRQLVRDVLEVIAEHPAELAVYLQESPHLATQLPRRQFNELRRGEDRFTKYVIDLVRLGVEQDRLRQVDPQLAALAVIGMVAWASRWYAYMEGADIERITDVFTDIALRGLGSEAVVKSLSEPGRATSA